jgi:hypothetical protein
LGRAAEAHEKKKFESFKLMIGKTFGPCRKGRRKNEF